MSNKLIICIVDGMADDPSLYPLGESPLMAAKTPHMDWLADTSLLGLCATTPHGRSPGSEVGCLALLGYDASVHQLSRAALEACGLGLHLAPEQWVGRLNLLGLDAAGNICSAPPRVSQGQNHALQRFFSHSAHSIHSINDAQHLLLFSSAALLSEQGLATLPSLHDSYGLAPQALFSSLAAVPALEGLLQQLFSTLQDAHAKGDIPLFPWVWGSGKQSFLPLFRDIYNLDAALISGTPLLQGMGKLAGMHVPSIPSASGAIGTDLCAKVAAVQQVLSHMDVVFLHIEEADIYSHLRDWSGKRDSLSRIDKECIGPLREICTSTGTALLLTTDHATLCATGSHDACSVPFLLYPTRPIAHPEVAFTEITAGRSGVSCTALHALLALALEGII